MEGMASKWRFCFDDKSKRNSARRAYRNGKITGRRLGEDTPASRSRRQTHYRFARTLFFQSPAYLSIEMIAAAMGGNPFTWPAGVYLSDGKFNHILMAMETILDRSGVHYNPVYGTPEEDKELERSYKHLCDLRDEVIAMGIIPPVSEWNKLNKNIE